MNILILYSSVTGNTKYLAKSLKSSEYSRLIFLPAYPLPKNFDYDIIFLGFWFYRGAPDPRMIRIMQQLKGKNIALFGTLSAYPHSEHAKKVLTKAQDYLTGNTRAFPEMIENFAGEKLFIKSFFTCTPLQKFLYFIIKFIRNYLWKSSILDSFLCLGRLDEKRYQHKLTNPSIKHPMKAERKERLLKGQKYPNQDDCKNFQAFFEEIISEQK